MSPRDRLNADLCAVLTTLAELPDGSSPRTPIYLVLGTDMDRLNLVEDVLLRGGLATKTAEILTITPKGREMAAKIEAHVEKLKGGA